MKPRAFIASSAVALIAAGSYCFPPAPKPQAAPETASAPPPPEEAGSPRANQDPQDVFQRAFWRRPTADDRILHAERREWVSEEDGILRWQWFLAVEPGPGLYRWLHEENAFGLAKVAGGTCIENLPQAPSWFPDPNKTGGCEIRRAVGKMLTLIFEPAGKVVYATDTGRGFAMPRKPSVIDTSEGRRSDSDGKRPYHVDAGGRASGLRQGIRQGIQEGEG